MLKSWLNKFLEWLYFQWSLRIDRKITKMCLNFIHILFFNCKKILLASNFRKAHRLQNIALIGILWKRKCSIFFLQKSGICNCICFFSSNFPPNKLSKNTLSTYVNIDHKCFKIYQIEEKSHGLHSLLKEIIFSILGQKKWVDILSK